MIRSTCLVLGLAVLTGDLLQAQSNSRGSGYDGALYTIGSATIYGRRGPAYPNGEIGMAFMNGLCNPGTINLEWRAPMLEDHPKFGFMVARLVGDRMVQVSDWSYCKHAFLSLNDNGSYPQTCGTSPCANTASAQIMYTNCYDVYAASNNASRNYLGPPAEIDPWLGTWNHIGSYFDQGDPNVGPPQNMDGIRSTINTFGDPVKNRVTIKEQGIVGVQNGELFFQIHVLHEGEPVQNRDNNLMSRPFNLTYTGSGGSGWSRQTTGTAQHGSILTRWPGSTLTMGGNGNDDGRFAIAVKVTGPTNGLWHYEYAVHNIDNHRGGAAFRLPICPTAQVSNFGFRDIDDNLLNEWTASFSNGEIAWTAPAGNPHNWNTIYNYSFDCDIAPVAGSATFDAARIGTGALQFAVATTVPGLQPAVDLGAGCGTPTMVLRANGVPSAGNANFGIDVVSAPATGLFAFYSFAAATTTVAPGCLQYLDSALLGTHGFLLTDGAGHATIPLAVPANFPPMDLYWQAVSLIQGGPLYNQLGLSNGLQVRLASTGCN